MLDRVTELTGEESTQIEEVVLAVPRALAGGERDPNRLREAAIGAGRAALEHAEGGERFMWVLLIQQLVEIQVLAARSS